jgi:hypothetical protein
MEQILKQKIKDYQEHLYNELCDDPLFDMFNAAHKVAQNESLLIGIQSLLLHEFQAIDPNFELNKVCTDIQVWQSVIALAKRWSK